METQQNLQLEFRNGIWVYKNANIYSVVPVIRSSKKDRVINHIGLYTQVDVLYLNNSGHVNVCISLNRRNPLSDGSIYYILEDKFGREFAKIKTREYIENINMEKFSAEIEAIGELERTLRSELKGNYRQRRES